MNYTDLQKKQIKNGFDSGKYLIIYKQYDAAKYSWLTTSTPEWRWDINEYRMLINTTTPPNESDMADIYAYYCYPYLYYHEDNKLLVRTPIMLPSPYGSFVGSVEAQDFTARNGHIVVGTDDTDSDANNKSGDITIIAPASATETFSDTNPKLIFQSSEPLDDFDYHSRVALQYSDRLTSDEIPTLSLTSDTANKNSDKATFKTPYLSVTEEAAIKSITLASLTVNGSSHFTDDIKIDGNLVVKGETTTQNTTVETLNYKRIEVDSTNEVGLDTADTDSVLIGDKTEENLGIDANEIQARNNGEESTLYLNPQGGSVCIGKMNITYDFEDKCLRFSYES